MKYHIEILHERNSKLKILIYNWLKTKMIKFLNKSFFSFCLISFLVLAIPLQVNAKYVSNLNNIFVLAQQKTIINYEKSQPSSIDNPVVDPNFNVMRASDTESSTATYIVIGLLIAATIIPLATWWYFSK